MRFEERLQGAVFLRRYKRFLVDVALDGGRTMTVHCPNTGSMTGCLAPGCPVLLSRSDNPRRKYPHTLELTRPGTCWIGVNTARTNHLVREGLENGVIDSFGPLRALRAEVKTSAASRLDFRLTADEGEIYLEVKNCTLAEDGVAMFPDAVTARGTRHLLELARLRADGARAAVLFCVQREDAHVFAPAWKYDRLYCETLVEVAAQGVEILAWQAEVDPAGVRIARPLPVDLLNGAP